MISLRTLKSETGCRRVLFLSMDRLAVYHCPEQKSVWPFLFDTTEAGMRHFDRYLRETPPVTTFLLVDVVQEEYRQDVIPHVSGPDQRALITRKRQQFFRDTPYFHTEIQGREEKNRRDDIVLFTALTNPILVQPWVKLLMENRVPLAGICSLPQLTGLLLDHLPGNPQQKLVVSLQSISGLRQTFFRNNKLQMSRLVDLPLCRTAYCIERINEEVKVMLRYLNSMHQLDDNKPLAICYLTGAPVLHDLQISMSDNPGFHHHFIDVGDLAVLLGLYDKIATPFCDQLLVYLLLTRKLPNYYASREELRDYRRRKAGLLMHSAATGMICTTLLWGAFNYINGSAYSYRISAAAQKEEYFELLNRIARKKLPALQVAPLDLKVLSDISHELQQQRAGPLEMLQVISKVMNRFPMVQLEQISWSANATMVVNDTDTDTGARQSGATSAVTRSGINSAQHYQEATLYGSVHEFEGDYRKVLDMIGSFSEALENTEQVHDVTILDLPLDVGPATSLEGSSVTVPGDARFSIRVVMELHIET